MKHFSSDERRREWTSVQHEMTSDRNAQNIKSRIKGDWQEKDRNSRFQKRSVDFGGIDNSMQHDADQERLSQESSRCRLYKKHVMCDVFTSWNV